MQRRTGQTTRLLSDIIGATRLDEPKRICVIVSTYSYATGLKYTLCKMLNSLGIVWETTLPGKTNRVTLTKSENVIEFMPVSHIRPRRGPVDTILVDSSCYSLVEKPEYLTYKFREDLQELYENYRWNHPSHKDIPEWVSQRNTGWGRVINWISRLWRPST